jgi:hypothetical protein
LRTEYVLRGILHANYNFQDLERLIWFQIGLFSYGEETHLPQEKNHLC